MKEFEVEWPEKEKIRNGIAEIKGKRISKGLPTEARVARRGEKSRTLGKQNAAYPYNPVLFTSAKG